MRKMLHLTFTWNVREYVELTFSPPVFIRKTTLEKIKHQPKAWSQQGFPVSCHLLISRAITSSHGSTEFISKHVKASTQQGSLTTVYNMLCIRIISKKNLRVIQEETRAIEKLRHDRYFCLFFFNPK